VPNLSAKSYAFEYAYDVTDSAHLLGSVTGPAHKVVNTWLSDRDALDVKDNQENVVATTTRSSYDYAVNKLTQRTEVVTAGTAFTTAPTIDWGYNSRGELASADSDTGSTDDRHFTFDGIGNRTDSRVGTAIVTGGTGTSYSPNALNQYTGASQNFDYDLDGNLTEGGLHSGALAATTGTAYTGTLTWDAENRLIKVEDTTPTTMATYSYDFQGRRMSKTVGGTTTWYVYDGWSLIAEYTGTTLSKTYTWGLDISGSTQGAGGVGGLLAVSDEVASGDPVYYPTYDGNGNVSEYLDSGGLVSIHFEYDPFGNLTAIDDTNGGTYPNEGDFQFRFSTKIQEDETGLYYYGYRFYDPVTGRWPSRDPIGERGGLNLYGFVGNNGISSLDVLGHWTRSSWNGKRGKYSGSVCAQKDDTWEALIKAVVGADVPGLAVPKTNPVAGRTYKKIVPALLVALEDRLRQATAKAAKTYGGGFGPRRLRGNEWNIGAGGIGELWGGNAHKLQYELDCTTATALVMAKGVADTIGTADFDKLYTAFDFADPNGAMLEYSGVNSPKEMLLGDWGYFKNIKDYESHNKGGSWIGENVIKVGDDQFWGHGLDELSTANHIREALERESNVENPKIVGFVGSKNKFTNVSKLGGNIFDLRIMNKK